VVQENLTQPFIYFFKIKIHIVNEKFDT